MEDICRLCCSNKFVNNYIFDEENALYLKMSLYLPIKVFKNDRLPQRICDRCSCKVNDFYQFCNETIEVQNRLRAVLISTAVEVEDSIDLTLIKNNDFSPLPHNPSISEIETKPLADPTQSNLPTVFPYKEPHLPTNENKPFKDPSEKQIPEKPPETLIPSMQPKETRTQSTQTELETDSSPKNINIDVPLPPNIQIKEEPKQEVHDVKMEQDYGDDNAFYSNVPSDNSEDDMSLIQFKKKKSKKVKVANGKMDKRKKKKNNLKEWEKLMLALPEGTALTMVDNNQEDVKVDVKQELAALGARPVKAEPVEFHCCVCFVQCYSRAEMLHHYREHGAAVESLPTPPAPPPPDGAAEIKCMRCQKRVEREAWAQHWARHWDKDRRPYRCALCERTYREPQQILKHGLSHKWGEEPTEQTALPEKRFVCDVCPESFVYMRYLLAHRATAHPEAASRALMLRCAVCDRQFAHLNSLRRHLRAHTGERNFLCNICGKALSSREHLKFHIRIHTGYKPNVCKTCGKGFVKKCNLTLHERVHSGERPHVCPHCGKAFSQRSTLVIHERYHSGARPYVCGLCNRGFVAKGLLSMHLKTTCI